MKKIISILMAISIFIACFGCGVCDVNVAYAKTYTNAKKTFSISTSEMYRPTMLKKGANFTIKGKIKSTQKLKKISISVEDLDQFTTELSYTQKISGKTVNLKNYASKIKFSKLTSGSKRLRIKLTAQDGSSVNCNRLFTVLGVAKEPTHITKKCKITVSKGKVENATDKSDETYWNSGTMTITLPKNKTVDGILIKWFSSKNDYTLKSYSKDGKVLDNYNGDDLYFLHQYYTIDDEATKVVIKLKKNKNSGYGIATLRVYEQGKVGVSVERWERPKTNQCDLMVISCHRDDELLYFGGTIPYYQSVKGKTVYTVYMSGNDRPRVREALAGQWAMGTKSYPIFMGFAGGYHDGVSGTIKDWGGENYCLKKLVEKIRKYHPDVIVTHDTDGEYGHPSHKATSYLVEKAVKLAGDKTKYKESYKKYGVCKVKKLYKHYTNTNKIYMNWNTSYPQLNGKSPIQVATIGFDKHQSQQPKWTMTCKAVKQCPNNQFGLVYTRVGKDKKKNDFFENID